MMITNFLGVEFVFLCWTGFMFLGGLMIGIEKQKEVYEKGGDRNE